MRKVAFLVATDECPEDPGIPKLLFPRSDAETLAEILADKETCGFEPHVRHVHVNEPSYKVLEVLCDICGQLKADDTLLYYYYTKLATLHLAQLPDFSRQCYFVSMG